MMNEGENKRENNFISIFISYSDLKINKKKICYIFLIFLNNIISMQKKIYCFFQKIIYNTIKTKKINNNNKYSYYYYYFRRNDIFKHRIMIHGFHFTIKK